MSKEITVIIHNNGHTELVAERASLVDLCRAQHMITSAILQIQGIDHQDLFSIVQEKEEK